MIQPCCKYREYLCDTAICFVYKSKTILIVYRGGRFEMISWSQYKRLIISKAQKQGKTEEYIQTYLSYAEPLVKKGLPVITSITHLAHMVGLKHHYLCAMAYAPAKFYRRFSIKKKNGGNRMIHEPLPDLKRVQKWILNEILSKIPVSIFAKAYIKGQTLRANARFHVKQKVVVSLDLKDFFSNINSYHIYMIFFQMGYKKNISLFLTNLCCLNGALPQGAPTSPYLSNIRMHEVDDALGKFCTQNKLRYTRYADDMTFSGDVNVKEIISYVRKELYRAGFQLNKEKTRVARGNACQKVTGIVVNERMQAPRDLRRRLRQIVYYIRKYGLESHIKHINDTHRNYLLHIIGQLQFALFVNPKDSKIKSDLLFLKNIYKNLQESF